MTDTSSLMLPTQLAVSSDCLYNLKPSSVRGRSYRASIPTSNKSTFTPGDQAILYIPGGRKNTYLDVTQSYLRFTVQNLDTTLVNYFFTDNNGACFINRLDTFHSGNNLDTIQAYNVLYAYILDMQLNIAEVLLLNQGRTFTFDTQTKGPSTNLGILQRDIQLANSKSNSLSCFYCQNPPRVIARPYVNLIQINIMNNSTFSGGILNYNNGTPVFGTTPSNQNFLTDTNSNGNTIFNDMTAYTMLIEFIPIANSVIM
jgi:hypothetical protein